MIKIDETKLFDVRCNDYQLSIIDFIEINKYYEACCTAEYLLENYPNLANNEEKAIELGYQVRDLMCKYDYDEEEAIEDIIFFNRKELGED